MTYNVFGGILNLVLGPSGGISMKLDLWCVWWDVKPCSLSQWTDFNDTWPTCLVGH